MKINDLELNKNKQDVHDFWNEASCGEELYLKGDNQQAYQEQANARYALEGEMISNIADFASSKGQRVLEIGVGLGADHQRFAEAGADLHGIDLTEQAISHTRKRFKAFGLQSSLQTGDAENLDFETSSFDRVYSWGVLHHSPDTPAAIAEVHRVLRPGGSARIMIYHKWSMVGIMLWIRYALLTLKPWRSLAFIYSNFLESPGTKAYSLKEGYKLFSAFPQVTITTPLTHGDLLESKAGQRHSGKILTVARLLWPRWLIRFLFPRAGLFMIIHAVK